MADQDSGEKPAEEPGGPVTTIAYEELRVMRTVGTGTFGRVKMVQHKSTSTVSCRFSRVL